ncbi:Uma2 family endonuclease [Pseudonocardia humida]|uniref:Uma2 family endonuclease n=1 Tax=Pseudonocardia humida TaxID=2800819 RepID=A0ABT1A356_9PSEU|nr:Uma2 family endonuclease [Pseudonocardia humida]MCO1657378.1 Uma2 family endonuclease [Pseudonocardia humida]
MTALPQPVSAGSFDHPLTVADYMALPEEPASRLELQEGSVVMSPRPTFRHQKCINELYTQLRDQVSDDLDLASEVEVDLRLVPDTHPGTVRVPDLVVVRSAAVDRLDAEGGALRPDEVVLAVEILSPGSRRTDSIIKHSEYADAGIGHYWIIDRTDGPSLTACHLGGEFGYVDAEPVKGVFETDSPFPARVDLAALV